MCGAILRSFDSALDVVAVMVSAFPLVTVPIPLVPSFVVGGRIDPFFSYISSTLEAERVEKFCLLLRGLI